MASRAELTTIRRLSQYRPFERGGKTSAEAQEDLLIAAFAEAGGRIESVTACQEAVRALFNLSFDEVEVGKALNTLLRDRIIERNAGGFALAEAERQRLEAVAANSGAVAEQAVAEWLGSIAERFPGVSEDEEKCLRDDLDQYLRAVIQRHGAEAALLLYPDEADAQRLYEDLEEMGFNFLEGRGARLQEMRQFALQQFMRNPTDAQRTFLSQNLSTGYFWTVLSIDPEGARLVQQLAQGQRVYLDTNFIFRLLGIQGPRHIRPAELLLTLTQGAGYEVSVTPWTIEELRRRLNASRDFLKRHNVPPSEYASLAADATSDEDFVTMYWRRVKEEPGLKPDDFLVYYEEVKSHLKAWRVEVRHEGCEAVENRHEDIHAEVTLLEHITHGGRQRPLKTLQHDAMHRLLIEKRRGDANRTFATAGCWFLTYDSVLPRYDNYARQGTSELPFCVSAGSWFQVVEAFTPKSNDLGQALADMLASPYVRYRRTLSKTAAQAIAARTHLYTNGTPELAARVFMNTAALDAVEAATTSEEEIEKIDSAIVAAAKDMHDEARRAKEQADVARARARERELTAEQHVHETERRWEAAVAQVRALGDEAVKNQAARGERALRDEAARRDVELASEREQHRRELEAATKLTKEQEGIARHARRRLRLSIGLVWLVSGDGAVSIGSNAPSGRAYYRHRHIPISGRQPFHVLSKWRTLRANLPAPARSIASSNSSIGRPPAQVVACSSRRSSIPWGWLSNAPTRNESGSVTSIPYAVRRSLR